MRRFGVRGLQDDAGAVLSVGISRFYWLRDWKFNPDRVKREMDSDFQLAGYRFARCLSQVSQEGEGGYWDGRYIDDRWPYHDELVASLTEAAYQRGGRIQWTIFGKAPRFYGSAEQHARLAYAMRQAHVLASVAKGVQFVEIMNEPNIVSQISPQEILELWDLFKSIAPDLLVGTGDVMSFGHYQYFPSLDAQWHATQREVGIAHMDRSMSASEQRDRPWRQAWDYGLMGDLWCDNEPIGPASSVNSESDPIRLRSHRLVAFISGAAMTTFHGEFGVRGDTPGHVTPDVPGYWECPRAVRFLDPNVVNEAPQNANHRYPNRVFDFRQSDQRETNGNTRGLVRIYGRGRYYVPFGMLTPTPIYPTRDVKINVYDQDLGEQVDARDLSAGEPYVVPAVQDRLIEVVQ